MTEIFKKMLYSMNKWVSECWWTQNTEKGNFIHQICVDITIDKEVQIQHLQAQHTACYISPAWGKFMPQMPGYSLLWCIRVTYQHYGYVCGLYFLEVVFELSEYEYEHTIWNRLNKSGYIHLLLLQLNNLMSFMWVE